jgi:hypothetical protein
MRIASSWQAGVAAACLLAVPLQGLALDPAGCVALANVQKFPEYPTQITLTQFLEAGVRGIPYGTRFEVRLPVEWNGRFMFQGGGTQGSLPRGDRQRRHRVARPRSVRRRCLHIAITAALLTFVRSG